MEASDPTNEIEKSEEPSVLVEFFDRLRNNYCLPFFKLHNLEHEEVLCKCGYDSAFPPKFESLEKLELHAREVLKWTLKETKARNDKKEMELMREEIKAYHEMRITRWSDGSSGFFAFPILFCPDSVFMHDMIEKGGHRECSYCAWC